MESSSNSSLMVHSNLNFYLGIDLKGGLKFILKFSNSTLKQITIRIDSHVQNLHSSSAIIPVSGLATDTHNKLSPKPQLIRICTLAVEIFLTDMNVNIHQKARQMHGKASKHQRGKWRICKKKGERNRVRIQPVDVSLP